MLAKQMPLRGAPARRRTTVRATAEPKTATATRIVVKSYGTATMKGTSRKINEDRLDVKVSPPGAVGAPFAWTGVYDGHGGFAVADWLSKKLYPVVEKEWASGYKPDFAITEAYLAADRQLLSRGGGFMSMGERGIGGSKCGATAANALLFRDADGSTKLLTANVGDARIVLVRDGGEAVQLSEDHVPDSEKERDRIESQNPNPRLPLVRYAGGTWRVGGLLALSRAFGDAYLKGSLQFEGLAAGSDGYSSGFGVIAVPYTTTTTLTGSDRWLVVATDGLYAEEERGGGGGLDNNMLVELLSGVGPDADLNKVAATLASTAVKVGSTDDVTLVLMRLGAE